MQRHKSKMFGRVAPIVLLMPLLSSCAIAPPFKKSLSLRDTALEDQIVIVGLTHVSLGKDKDKNRLFWRNTKAVLGTISKHDGYLGHGVRVHIFGREAWTMTVWKDDKSLDAFVRGAKHRQAMREGGPAMIDARFARIGVKRSEVPITWKRVDEILKDTGRQLSHRADL